MRTAEDIIADIDRIDAILETNRKDMMVLRQERQTLYDELVQLNRHDTTHSTA